MFSDLFSSDETSDATKHHVKLLSIQREILNEGSVKKV
jgi:hypothetical protein